MSKPQSIPFILGIALAACAVIAASLGFSYRHLEERFASEGVPADAVVLVKKLEENPNADSRYLLKLGYADGQRKAVQGWQAVPRPLWDSLKEGETVAVVYLQTEPATVRLVSPGTTDDGQLQLRLAAIGGVGALFAFAFWWWKPRRP